MSSSVTPSPRSVNSSPAAARIRCRLRSASRRSGRSASSGAVDMAHTLAQNGGAVSSLLLGLPKNLREFLHFFVGKPHMTHENPHHERRWAILALLGIAQ